MLASSARILLIADQVPPDAHAMNALLARPDLRFQIVPHTAARDALDADDYSAAVICAPHHCFNGRQRDFARILDKLADRQIGTVVVSDSDDFPAACQMAASEGLMAVPQSCSADELNGRLAGLLATRPIISGLRRENAILRKFDHGLNSQIEQMDEEMRLAARLQTDFLPRTLPRVGPSSFNVLFRPANYVSGDIYDVMRLDETHIGFYVADAVGHGMPAALLTIFIKRTLQTKEIPETGGAYRIVPPNEALTHLNNELLSQQLSMCQFVTMVYCILDTETLQLHYARAGHPAPLHLQQNGSVHELEIDGALLGVFPNESYPMATLQLYSGDSVLLHSDGFESAYHDTAHITSDRYRHEFAKLAARDPGAKFEKMVEELDAQEGSLHPRDDLTAVLLSIG